MMIGMFVLEIYYLFNKVVFFLNKKKLNDIYFFYIILNNDIFCIIFLFEKMLYCIYGISRINL